MSEHAGSKRSSLYRYQAAVIAAAGILLIAGCSSGSSSSSSKGTDSAPSSITAANACEGADGSITMYTAATATKVQEWVKPFTKKYGVSVKVYSAPMGTVNQRWEQENQAGKKIADIFSPNNVSSLENSQKNGWIARFVPANDSAYPADEKKTGLWYVIQTGAEPLAWNTDKVSDAEAKELASEGPKALADPKWKDRIAVVDPASTQRVLATYYRWVKDNPDLGWDWLEKLAKNNPGIYQGAKSLSDHLASGQYAVALGYPSQIAGYQIKEGAPIQFSYWGHISTSAPFFTAIAKNAPNMKGAACFQNWITSNDALVLGSKVNQSLPVLPGLPDGQIAATKSWYTPAPKLDLAWESDQKMFAEAEEFIAKWHDIMGVS